MNLRESRLSRDVNRFQLIQSGGNATKPDEVTSFDAYIDKSVAINLGAKFSDMLSSVTVDPKWNIMSTLALGRLASFDAPRWMNYQGASPLKLDIECYLQLHNDYVQDILTPLDTLFQWFLPKQEASLAEAMGDIGNQFQPLLNTILPNATLSSPTWNKAEDTISNQLAHTYTMSPPEIMNPLNGVSLFARIGSVGSEIVKGVKDSPEWILTIPEVFIKSVSLNYGRFMVEVGYPERVTLTISLETVRVATAGLAKSIFFNTKRPKAPNLVTGTPISKKGQSNQPYGGNSEEN